MPSSEEVTRRAGSLRAMAGFTEAEFQALLPHFAQALETSLGTRTLDGHPHTSRRSSAYVNGPLPTMAAMLLFILRYVHHTPIQALQGQLFGMSQSNPTKGIHPWHAVLNQAVADQACDSGDPLHCLLAPPV